MTAQPGNQRLADWVERLAISPLPILRSTINALDGYFSQRNLRFDEIAEMIHRDPAFTAQLLRVVNSERHGHLDNEITTVKRAIMMLGVERMKSLPKGLPTLDKLVTDEANRNALLTVMARSSHTAWQADDWTRLHHDINPDEVFTAALIHSLGEMLMWIHAPQQAREIAAMGRAGNSSPEEAQYVVLGFTYDELTLALARQWRLPSLLRHTLEAEHAIHDRERGIMLAANLARLAEEGWYHPAMYRCQEQVALHLHAELDETAARLHDTAIEAARAAPFPGIAVAAALLPRCDVVPQTISDGFRNRRGVDEAGQQLPFCLIAHPQRLREALDALNRCHGKSTLNDIIHLALDGLHDGIALNRTVFATLTPDHGELKAFTIKGADSDLLFDNFDFLLEKDDLFSRLLQKQQAVWLNDGNSERFTPLVPEALRQRPGTERFFAMSVVIAGRPFGLFYADRHGHGCPLEESDYREFKKVCIHATKALQRLPALRHAK